jgi:hypothetical protein
LNILQRAERKALKSIENEVVETRAKLVDMADVSIRLVSVEKENVHIRQQLAEITDRYEMDTNQLTLENQALVGKVDEMEKVRFYQNIFN